MDLACSTLAHAGSALPLTARMNANDPTASRSRRRILWGCAGVLMIWAVVSYVAIPETLLRRSHRHPALNNAPKVTTTPAGIPGDPLNLFIVAPEEKLVSAMLKSGWYPADPVTLKSSLRIAVDSVARRPYDEAPVSALLLFGKIQDLAFEKPEGGNPRERHHVRFWKAPGDRKPAWWGAATFDRSVGLSHTTGQITHHIAAEVDKERELILETLKSGGFQSISRENGFQKSAGKNGGGDPWQSDGSLGIAEWDPAS